MSSKTSEEYASVTLKSAYGVSSTALVVIGVQLFTCIFGLTIFMETPPSRRQGRHIYILISFIILALSILNEIGDGFQEFHLLYGPSTPLEAMALRRLDDHTWWAVGTTSCSTLVNWIGDGLLIYRCYIVWRGKWWICLFPLMAYLGSVAMSIYSIASIFIDTPQSQRFDPHGLSVWITLSVVVNCMVTGLISYKLIKMRRKMAKLFPLHTDEGLVGVVAILFESALPLSLAGIAFSVVIYMTSVTGLVIRAVFLSLWFAFNALSPQLIIFRVTIGRSWSHEGPDSDPIFSVGLAEDIHRISPISHSPFPLSKEQPHESNSDDRMSLTTLQRGGTPNIHND